MKFKNYIIRPSKMCVWCKRRKILGIHVHAQGIEANPDKCSAILDTQSPTTLKKVQSLVGKLTSLSRFLPKLVEKIRLIVKTLKKADRFQGSDECEKTFTEILEALWAYRCTPQTSTGESPYNLTYGTDAMLSVEIGEATIRRQLRDLSLNNECMKTELDLLDELREKARIKEAVCKQKAARRYNAKVNPRSFQQGDLVWRLTGDARKNQTDGKFAAN